MGIINQAYKKDIGRCSGPIYFPGETYSFYLAVNTSDPDFANFRLDIRRLGESVAVLTDIGVLTQDVINVYGFYNIHSTFSFPDLPFGWYEFVIYDTVNLIEKAVSNPVQVEVESEVENTAIVSYRNEIDKYGIRYEANPDYWNRVRLPLIQIDWKLERDMKQYRNVSNGRLRNYGVVTDEIARIESYYVNEEMHRAIAAIYDHDQIFLDSTFVIPKEAYTIESRQNSVLSKGAIDVVIDDSVELPDSLITLVTEFNPVDYSDEFS